MCRHNVNMFETHWINVHVHAAFVSVCTLKKKNKKPGQNTNDRRLENIRLLIYAKDQFIISTHILTALC